MVKKSVVRVMVSLPCEVVEALESEASERKLTKSAIVSDVLQKHFAYMRRKNRDATVADGNVQ